jgi:secondary thiamine-phosphate synthase enzyme
MKTLSVRSREREQLIDVTAQVRQAIAGVADGLVCVFSPHTTAAITVQENSDPDVVTDFLGHLGKLIPQPGFRHGEGNADAHIKCSLVGPSVTLIIDQGELVLGRWQAIFFCEFDGPRERKIHVKLLERGPG